MNERRKIQKRSTIPQLFPQKHIPLCTCKANMTQSSNQRRLILTLLGMIIAGSLTLRHQFDYTRHYLEYYYDIVKWHVIIPTCMHTTSTNHIHMVTQNTSWDTLLSNQLAYTRDRWVVSTPHVGLGLCNRILHSLSALIFAMATNRSLWIEWEEQPYQYITSNEYAGMSSYDSLFVSEFHNARFRPPPHLIEGALNVEHEICFLNKVRYSSDLNQDYNAQVLRMEGGDWWAPLVIKNQANTMFKGLTLTDGFPLLFKAMFTLHPPKVEPEECSWIIQYRTIWPPPRHTAPIESFLSCARDHGLTPTDYHTTWIVADDPISLMAHATPEATRILSAMNPPRPSCRGPCGDREALETMYRLSRCRNAVLTLGSSFGSCISSLAGASRQFRVSEHGECLAFPHTDGPIDASSYSRKGTLKTYLTQRTD